MIHWHATRQMWMLAVLLLFVYWKCGVWIELGALVAVQRCGGKQLVQSNNKLIGGNYLHNQMEQLWCQRFGVKGLIYWEITNDSIIGVMKLVITTRFDKTYLPGFNIIIDFVTKTGFAAWKKLL